MTLLRILAASLALGITAAAQDAATTNAEPPAEARAALIVGTPKAVSRVRGRRSDIRAEDSVSFTIPTKNPKGNPAPLVNVRIELTRKPAWLEMRPTSRRGPVTLPPGGISRFFLDFRVSTNTRPSGEAEEVVAEIKTDTTRLMARRFVWHFRTQNSFRTASGECLDEEGGSYGGFVSPHDEPPVTRLTFTGPAFADHQSDIRVSTGTEISLESDETLIPDAVSAETQDIRFALDRNPKGFADMDLYKTAFKLRPGDHKLAIASRDVAGNTEMIESISIHVLPSLLAVSGFEPVSELDFGGLRTTAGPAQAATPEHFRYTASEIAPLMLLPR